MTQLTVVVKIEIDDPSAFDLQDFVDSVHATVRDCTEWGTHSHSTISIPNALGELEKFSDLEE